MAYIVPFRALRYDPKRVAPSSVVTQPYDKITPESQERYYASSPHNLVRLILGKREPADNEQDNVYSRAAGFFRDWRRDGIFLQDPQPSIYAYSQRFRVPGTNKEAERLGFIALGRVEDYSANVAFRHEQTLAKPKADRLDLLRATRSHFGQIFMLYNDTGEIDSLLSRDDTPTTEVTDEYGVLNRIWRISDPSLIELAMMTFVNMNSAGLTILPTHRVVHSLTAFSAETFESAARVHFNVEQVDSAVDAARATAILREAGHVGTAILAVAASRVFLLHTPKAPASMFPGLSVGQQFLDVVQVHKVLLEGVLSLSEESIREQRNLSYVRDAGEAISTVRSGAADVAFLMNPCRMEQVRDIAFAGEVLPQKSTDFFPKLLSGLTIYALE